MPKVSAVRSTRPLAHKSEVFAVLSRFLKTEQEKQDPGAIQHSHWEDLFHVCETLVSNNKADQVQLLRELRLSAPRSISSSSPAVRAAVVFDEERGKKAVKVEHEHPMKKEGTESETPLTKEEEKERKKAAKKAKKEAKEIKKEIKKEKKRKREHSDESSP